jgi:hypothetical protein
MKIVTVKTAITAIAIAVIQSVAGMGWHLQM